jgi:hypothetical protein
MIFACKAFGLLPKSGFSAYLLRSAKRFTLPEPRPLHQDRLNLDTLAAVITQSRIVVVAKTGGQT